jgi:hypothetical protein
MQVKFIRNNEEELMPPPMGNLVSRMAKDEE